MSAWAVGAIGPPTRQARATRPIAGAVIVMALAVGGECGRGIEARAPASVVPPSHRRVAPRAARQQCSQQRLTVDRIGLRSPPTPWHGDRRGIDHMAFDTICFEQSVNPEAVARLPE